MGVWAGEGLRCPASGWQSRGLPTVGGSQCRASRAPPSQVQLPLPGPVDVEAQRGAEDPYVALVAAEGLQEEVA
eukprot:8299551-Pyramimonas_sp.AAC.1